MTVNPDGIRVVEEVEQWFGRKYPNADWRSRKFDCFSNVPTALRMFPMMGHLEAEIVNGGLAQFLWNTFFHWERVLSECEQAYQTIGALRHAIAIPVLRTRILENVDACRRHVEKAIQHQDPDEFERWYDNAEQTMSIPEEESFSDTDDLDAYRSKWAACNAALLRRLMSNALG